MPEDNVRDMWSEEELDRALAALKPAGDVDDRVFQRAKAELLVAAGGREPAPEPAPPRRRRWAWWAASVGTVAAMVASVLVVQTVHFGDRMPNAAAVEQLNSAAEKAGAVDEPLAPGQYRYIATHAWWMANTEEYSYLAENLLETWVPADERDEWLWRRDVTGARKWVTGSEEEARAAGFPIDEPGWPEGEWRAPCGDWFAEEEGREPCAKKGSWENPDEEFLASLPRDTQALYDRLRADTNGRGQDPDLEMIVYVADLLRTGLVPADLRAALYRALAKVPGLEITEQVANLDGVEGTAYGISAKGMRHDVIVDPKTGQFIGEREVAEEGFANVPAGTVMEYTSVTTAVVPAMGAHP